MRHYRSAFVVVLFLVGCQNSSMDEVDRASTDSDLIGSENTAVSDILEPSNNLVSDTLIVEGRTVVFFTPTPDEIKAKFSEPDLVNGLQQALGDFQYYAGLIQDSLQTQQIPTEFSSAANFKISNAKGSQWFDRKESQYLMGMILSDPEQEPQFVYGMHTHLSWWELITDYYHGTDSSQATLLEYFTPVQADSLHIYSSHEKILDHFGNPIPAQYYPLFGNRVNQKALSRGMSIFAYHQFKIGTDQFGLICRIPSRYDESAIHLFIWDQTKEQIVAQLELAENLWHNERITVKDSWLNRSNGWQIVQRSKEAWLEKDGQRKETDQWSHLTVQNGKFTELPLESLRKGHYQLHDWEQSAVAQPLAVKKEAYWVDDAYLLNPLIDGPLSSQHLISIQPDVQVSKEAVANQYQPQQIDTVVTITFENSYFKFYRAPEKELFISASLNNPWAVLKKGVSIGSTKSTVAAQFAKTSTDGLPDIIKIGDAQKDRVITCYFESDTLSHITIESYID